MTATTTLFMNVRILTNATYCSIGINLAQMKLCEVIADNFIDVAKCQFNKIENKWYIALA